MKDHHYFEGLNEDELIEIRQKFEGLSKNYEYLRGRYDEMFSTQMVGVFIVIGGFLISLFIKDSYATMILSIIGMAIVVGSTVAQFHNLSKRRKNLFQMRQVMFHADAT